MSSFLIAPGWLLVLSLSAMMLTGWLIWRRRGVPRVIEPSCGQCGYSVRGLPTFTCPECGRDLREVGIVAPNVPRQAWIGFSLIAWTLAAPAAGWALTQVVALAVPRQHNATKWFTATPKSSGPAVTVFGRLHRAVFSGTTDVNSLNLRFQALRSIDRDPSVGGMTINLMDMNYVYHAEQSARDGPAPSGPLTERAMLAWVASWGVDPNLDIVQQQSGELVRLVKELAADRTPEEFASQHWRIALTGSNVYSSMPRLFRLMAVALTVLLWIGGMVWLVRRHRSVREGSAPTATAGS